MFVGRTSRGHTGRSHRIFHPPSFCGACLNFSREKDSAIPFVKSTLVGHFFFFFSEKNPVYWDRTHVPTCQKVRRLPLSYRDDNFYYIWPMTLLELKYVITPARNAAAIANGMVELRSIVFYSREEREQRRQGPRGLRCSKLRRIGGLGRLNDGSPKVKSMRRVYPRVDYTQAPWTAVMLRQPRQSIHTSREA